MSRQPWSSATAAAAAPLPPASSTCRPATPTGSANATGPAGTVPPARQCVTLDAATDTWLWRVMQSEKNRAMVARLEHTLLTFVVDDTHSTTLTFPPRNAFHRRVCHAVALRYGLDHRLEHAATGPSPAPKSTADIPDDGQQQQRGPRREQRQDGYHLVLLRTPHCAPPSTTLHAFAQGPPPPAVVQSVPLSLRTPIAPSPSAPTSLRFPSCAPQPPAVTLAPQPPALAASSSPPSAPPRPISSSAVIVTAVPVAYPTATISSIVDTSSSSSAPMRPTQVPMQSLDGEGACVATASSVHADGLAQLPAKQRPATFLRRPRMANSKGRLRSTVAGTGAAAQNKTAGGGAAIKSISEEDYQKARARIFNAGDAAARLNGAQIIGDAGAGADERHGENVDRVVKLDSLAKGPVEGSRGFERRRNRRPGEVNASPAGPVLGPGSAGNAGSDAKNSFGSGAMRKGGMGVEERGGGGGDRIGVRNGGGRPGRDVGNAGGTGGSGSAGLGGRRFGSDGNFGDLQDPDFDRSYTKWARREMVTATGGQAPVAGIGVPMYPPPQMMYPYGAQAVPQHPMHGGGMSVRHSMGLPTALPQHVSTPLTTLQSHVAGGLLQNGGGGAVGNGGGVGMGGGMTVGMSCAVSGGHGMEGMMQGNVLDGLSQHAAFDANMRLRMGVAQPPHAVNSMIEWSAQSMGMPMHAPPPQAPTYGLDSVVDFPPLG